MSAPILSLAHVKLTWGGKPLFEDINLYIERKQRYCLIGRNGSGKSTLLRIILGDVECDSGELFKQPGIKIHYLAQDPTFKPNTKILDYVMEEGAPKYQAEDFLGKLSLDPQRLIDDLSGGERRKVALARVLCGDPDLLLLDEPTNHLDLPTIEWLENYLNTFQGSIVVISHDRRFLSNVTNRTIWLDRGSLRYHDKGYFDYDRWSLEVLEEEERQISRFNVKLKQEMEWLHRGVTARRKRNQGRLRALNKLREEKRDRESKRQKDMKMGVASLDNISKLVVKATDITKKFGDRTIIQPFSIQIEKGERIGIVGPNGAGKTTLLKILVGDLKPDSGHIRLGKSIDLVYYDQMRSDLNPQKTLWENLSDGDYIEVQGHKRHIMGYLKDFLFEEKQIRGIVGILSGGEKNRLALAKCLALTSNLLILDEPTNDLDMDTLDLLIEYLSDYKGTLIIVSHDRDFLDRVTTSILSMDGTGEIKEYIGGFSDVKWPSQKAAKEKTKKPEIKKPVIAKPTFKEQYEYKKLTEEIENIEELIRQCEGDLADPTLFTKDPTKFDRLSKNLEEYKVQLCEKEERWMELAEKLEG